MKIDISKIKFQHKGGNVNSENGNRLIKKLTKLPSDTFFAYSEGHPKLPIMPYVAKETKTKNGEIKKHIYSIQPNRNQYPAVGFSCKGNKITIVMHKLIALCFIENSKPRVRNYVDHINEDNRKLLYKIYDAWGWGGDNSTQWQGLDWRIENLRWASANENIKNPQRSKKDNFDPTWVNWEHI